MRVRHYEKVYYRELPTGSIPIALWEKMAACGAFSRVISGGLGNKWLIEGLVPIGLFCKGSETNTRFIPVHLNH